MGGGGGGVMIGCIVWFTGKWACNREWVWGAGGRGGGVRAILGTLMFEQGKKDLPAQYKRFCHVSLTIVRYCS